MKRRGFLGLLGGTALGALLGIKPDVAETEKASSPARLVGRDVTIEINGKPLPASMPIMPEVVVYSEPVGFSGAFSADCDYSQWETSFSGYYKPEAPTVELSCRTVDGIEFNFIGEVEWLDIKADEATISASLTRQ